MALPSMRKLQQQQCEVASSLRVAINNNDAAEHVATAVGNVALFLRDMDDASDEMQLPVDFIIQALLSKLVTETDVQKQGGSEGNVVPMHQNKVLDRSNRVVVLDADRVKDQKWIIKQVNENLPKLLAALQTLRELVKIKVEDANDIEMARQWAGTATDFFDHLRMLSGTTGDLYSAWVAIEDGNLPDAAAADLKSTTVKKANTGDGGALSDEDVAAIQTLDVSFEDRVTVLNALASASEDAINAQIDGIRTGLVAQLRDNRSQTLRAAVPAARRVSEASQWDVVAHDVIAAILNRIHLANQGLSKLFSSALEAFVRQGLRGPAISHIAHAAATSQLQATQSKCAQLLTIHVGAHAPPPNAAVWAAADACVASKHGPCRTAGKALQAACKKAWPDFSPRAGAGGAAPVAADGAKAPAKAAVPRAPLRRAPASSASGKAATTTPRETQAGTQPRRGSKQEPKPPAAVAGKRMPPAKGSGARKGTDSSTADTADATNAAARPDLRKDRGVPPWKARKASRAAEASARAAHGERGSSDADADAPRHIRAVSSVDPPESTSPARPSADDVIVVDWPKRTGRPPQLSSRQKKAAPAPAGAVDADAAEPQGGGSALIEKSDSTQRVSLLAERRANFKGQVASLRDNKEDTTPAAPAAESANAPRSTGAAAARIAAAEGTAALDREATAQSASAAGDTPQTALEDFESPLTLLKSHMARRRSSVRSFRSCEEQCV